MSRFKCIGIGEVLWDLLPAGKQLGGAPSNFAYHTQALGAESKVISRVGNDPAGRELIGKLQSLNLNVDCIESDFDHPTSTVSVELSADGQASYTIHENVAWDFIAGESLSQDAVRSADAVYFGTLAQRSKTSRETIRRLLESTKQGALRVFDVNLRQHYFTKAIIEQSLKLADVLKINETELPALIEMFDLPRDEPEAMAELARRHSIRVVAYTHGAHGSRLLCAGVSSDFPGVPTQVVDTVGAGDSFTAALTIGLLKNWSLDQINDRAARIAAYVCSQAGATPKLPAELTGNFTQ